MSAFIKLTGLDLSGTDLPTLSDYSLGIPEDGLVEVFSPRFGVATSGANVTTLTGVKGGVATASGTVTLGQIAGRPALSTDGGSYLDTAIVPGVGAGTILAVGQRVDVTGIGAIVGDALNGYASLGCIFAKPFASIGGESAQQTAANYLVANVPIVLALRWTGATYELYVNGVQRLSRTATGVVAQGTLDIGRQGTLANQYWVGLIGDVAVYGRALTGGEMTSASQGLGAKYGMTI